MGSKPFAKTYRLYIQSRISSLLCGNKMPTRCNRCFYCRSYCLLNICRCTVEVLHLLPHLLPDGFYTVQISLTDAVSHTSTVGRLCFESNFWISQFESQSNVRCLQIIPVYCNITTLRTLSELMYIHNHLERGPRVRKNNVPMWCYLCIVSFRFDLEFIWYVEKFLPHTEQSPHPLQRTIYLRVKFDVLLTVHRP